MQVQTILNRVQRHRSFVYREARFRDGSDGLALDVAIEPRANGRPVCSGCGKRRPGYDRLPARRFQFVPLWGIAVFHPRAGRRDVFPVDRGCPSDRPGRNGSRFSRSTGAEFAG